MANPANTTAYALPDGRIAVNVTEAKTLAVADCGFVQNVTVDGVIFTLPATATLGTWTFRNGGKVSPTDTPSGDGLVGFQISPNSVDKIQGGVAGTPTDDKDLINAKATSHVGDGLTILNVAETNGPLVLGPVKGTWTREA